MMETRKMSLGAEQPNMLTSMYSLAYTWKSQSRNTDAISLMENCVKLQDQVLGPEHPDMKTSFEILRWWESEGDKLERSA